MVRSQSIQVADIGYRGYKSVIFYWLITITVKEQRVDGSWFRINFLHLRYTLMYFERNCQVKVLSKKVNIKLKRFFSSLPPSKQSCSEVFEEKLHPEFLSGLIDGEGSFGFYLVEKSNSTWGVQFNFSIGLHFKDKGICEKVKTSLGVGSINIKHGVQSVQFRVRSKKELAIVINHIDLYPLITQKNADCELLKLALELVNSNKSLTKEVLNKIIGIKTSMNWGLSYKLKAAFPDVVPVARPWLISRHLQEIRDPQWLAGFTTAEGCFSIKISKAQTLIGWRVELEFQITQHIRDEHLVKSLIQYLDCGIIYNHRNTCVYKVTKISDIHNKIIPFFKKYPVIGTKAKDFEKFCKVAEIMKSRKHLTKEGLEQIHKIRDSLNR